MKVTTTAWFASPTLQDRNQIIRFERIALGPVEVLDMLRDAEQIITERASQPDSATNTLVVFVDEPAKLFADETHGLLLQARAHSLARRASRGCGVRLEIQW